MTNQEMLISYINKLTEDEISSLLEDVALILEMKELTLKRRPVHIVAPAM